EHVIVGRPGGRQALARLLGLRHQVGLDTEVAERRGGLLAYGGHLDPGEGPRVQAVLFELLPHRPDRVCRGEGDPLVSPCDQALDGALHLLRGPPRPDRRGPGPPPAPPRRSATAPIPTRPAPWCAARAPASRTAACSRTRRALGAPRRHRRPRSRDRLRSARSPRPP